MINLLPPNGKKRVVFEYWTRVGSVWLLLIVMVLVAVGALLVPSYILLEGKLSALEREVAENQGTDEVFREAEDAVENANALARRLVKEEKRLPLSKIIREITTRAGGDITIRNFVASASSEEGKEGLREIKVQGTADSRESLAQFREALERSALFETAIVPISDLARDEDLPFLVTVVLASGVNGL